jgi:hypothetical protein
VIIDLTKDPPTARFVDSTGEFLAASFSPQGRVFVTGDTSGNVQFRDGRTFAPLGSPVKSSEAAVERVVFSSDATLLAVNDLGPSTRLIDSRTHQPIGDTINAAGDGTASFSPDGATMATSYENEPNEPLDVTAFQPRPGATALWELDPATWRKRACEIAGRNLTTSEARQYLPSEAGTQPTCARFER